MLCCAVCSLVRPRCSSGVPCVQVNVWLSAAESATVAQAGYDVIHRYRARPLDRARPPFDRGGRVMCGA
jgi:hypothetical protein